MNGRVISFSHLLFFVTQFYPFICVGDRLFCRPRAVRPTGADRNVPGERRPECPRRRRTPNGWSCSRELHSCASGLLAAAGCLPVENITTRLAIAPTTTPGRLNHYIIIIIIIIELLFTNTNSETQHCPGAGCLSIKE